MIDGKAKGAWARRAMACSLSLLMTLASVPTLALGEMVSSVSPEGAREEAPTDVSGEVAAAQALAQEVVDAVGDEPLARAEELRNRLLAARNGGVGNGPAAELLSLADATYPDALEATARAYAIVAALLSIDCEVMTTDAGGYHDVVTIDGKTYVMDASTDGASDSSDTAGPNPSDGEGEETPDVDAQDEQDDLTDPAENESLEEVTPDELAQDTEGLTNAQSEKGDVETPEIPIDEEKTSLADATISVDDQTYTGKALEPEVKVTLGDVSLVAGTDYRVSFENSTNVGTATVTVEGMGTYSGSVKGMFQIKAASIKAATVSVARSSYTYTSKAIRATPQVVLGGVTLKANTDYTVSYKDNVNVGTATVTIKGKGNYTGTTTAIFRITAARISKATAKAIAKQAYTGKSVKPSVSLTFGGKRLTNADYTLTYANNVKVGTATVTVRGKRNFTGTKKLTFKVVAPSVSYMVHVQRSGDQAWRKDGAVAGTSGLSRRLEAIRIKLGSGFPVSGGISYRTHVQGIGWQDWQSDGALSGTSGQSKRLEAIRIKLTGAMASKYDVYYRVHAQNVGWMAWAKNGATAGTSSMSWRLEAIQVTLVPKGGNAPGNVDGIASATSLKAFSKGSITYRSYLQGTSWQDWKGMGAVSGTGGESRRIEAIQAKLSSNSSIALSGSIQYRTNLQDSGWTEWSADGATSGTTGQSRRVETMQVKLTGQAGKYLDVWYRAYVQDIGWLDWTKNGQSAGTIDSCKRLEAYQMRLVPKGGAAPGSTAKSVWTKDDFDRKAEAEALAREQADPMYWAAQGYYSPTNWLLMVDCTTCSLGIFKGSRGNWRFHDKYLVGVGRYESPSRHGVWSIGGRGYSFGGSDYTCYYWISYYNDYLFHTVPCWRGTFDIKDPRLGEHVSAGCVRQPFDKAIWLYNNIPYGTTVVVYDA